jgi:hypothetical protein
LFAVEFDVKAGTIQGSPFVLIPHIGQVASPPVKPAVGVSRNGVMAYQAGGFDAGILTWFDRAGKSQGTIAVESGAQWLRFSPNGSQVASRQSGDFWIIDLARGASTRLTRTGRNSGGAWSPDGKQLAFGRENSKMFAVNVDGSGEVAMSENAQTPRGWSADGFDKRYGRQQSRFLTRWEICGIRGAPIDPAGSLHSSPAAWKRPDSGIPQRRQCAALAG